MGAAHAAPDGGKPSDPRPASPDEPAVAPKHVKFLEFGWGIPHVGLVNEHPERFRERLFDGVVLKPTDDGFHEGASGVPNAFDERRWTEEHVALEEMDRLDLDAAGIPFSMLILQASNHRREGQPDPAGWFDDAMWETIDHNLRLYSEAAERAGVVGYFFDTESYTTDPWTYTAERFPDHTLEETRAAMRERGATFMDALQSRTPEMRLVMIFGLCSDYVLDHPRVLTPAFYDGMLDVAGPGVSIVDGNENGYYHATAPTLDRFRQAQFDGHTMLAPEHQQSYIEKRRRAHGFYTDLVMQPETFGDLPFFASKLACFVDPGEKERFAVHHLFNHARMAEDFVWTWTEEYDWWRPVTGDADTAPTRAFRPVPEVMERVMRTVQRHIADGTAPEPIPHVVAEAQSRRMAHLEAEEAARAAREARAE